MGLLRDRRGISMLWWAVFFALVLVPVIVLSMGVARFSVAAAEVQEAADLAALAASRDVLVGFYENWGAVQFADMTWWHRAVTYTRLNTDYLNSNNIQIHLVEARIDELQDTVTVIVAADLSPLFPEFGLPLDPVIEREGVAKVRMRAWRP